MRKYSRILALAGLLLFLLSAWQIQAAGRGLQIVSLPGAQPPVTVFSPAGSPPSSRPVILVGHGFAGSSVVMRGFALTLAHAGYIVVTWDFDGHGSNPRPLASSPQGDKRSLVADAEQALQTAVQHGLADPTRVAILGHSMGSGVALDYGQVHPETAATVAISPVGQPVTPALPHNLLLLAGTAEASFLQNARELLAEAGGESGDPKAGTARKLVSIPGANHLTILFSDLANQTAREWLDGVFGSQPGAVPYTDRRLEWYLVALAGMVMAAIPAAGWLALPGSSSPRPAWQRLVALFAGSVFATLLLWLAGKGGLDLGQAFGLLVGGYLLVWFAAAGLLGLLLMRSWPERLSWRAVLAGLFTFVILWLGMGLLGSLVWLPWLLIARRLILWPLAAALILPWFLFVGEVQRRASGVGQAGVWLAQCAALFGALLLSIQLDSGLGFLILILPVFPIVLAVHALASSPYRGGWAYALSGALFTSWMVLAVFPLG